MAILKIINNTYNDNDVFSRIIEYAIYPKTYDEAGNVIGYSIAEYFGGNNLFIGSGNCNPAEMIAEQMRYVQTFYGKDFGQYLRHFILSFDSLNRETAITSEIAYNTALAICNNYFPHYQIFFAVHTNRLSHLHIHFIINTVNYTTGYKLLFNRTDHNNLANYIMNNMNLECCKVVYNSPNQ